MHQEEGERVREACMGRRVRGRPAWGGGRGRHASGGG